MFVKADAVGLSNFVDTAPGHLQTLYVKHYRPNECRTVHSHGSHGLLLCVCGGGIDKDHVLKVGNDQKKFGNHWNRMCTGKEVGLSQHVTSGLVNIGHAFVR